jgi:hypothetical protein
MRLTLRNLERQAQEARMILQLGGFGRVLNRERAGLYRTADGRFTIRDLYTPLRRHAAHLQTLSRSGRRWLVEDAVTGKTERFFRLKDAREHVGRIYNAQQP